MGWLSKSRRAAGVRCLVTKVIVMTTHFVAMQCYHDHDIQALKIEWVGYTDAPKTQAYAVESSKRLTSQFVCVTCFPTKQSLTICSRLVGPAGRVNNAGARYGVAKGWGDDSTPCLGFSKP